MASRSFLQLCRKLHLYFGLFISPALLFFAFTGAYQTLGLHESGGTTYKPPAWMATLAQIHKKQTPVLPVRRGGPPSVFPAGRPASGSTDRPDRPGSEPSPGSPRGEHTHASRGALEDGGANRQGSAQLPAPTGAPQQQPVTLASKQKQHLPLKIFFVLVSLGLLLSTFTGIYMSYKYDRNRILVTALLVLGAVVPLVLLRF